MKCIRENFCSPVRTFWNSSFVFYFSAFAFLQQCARPALRDTHCATSHTPLAMRPSIFFYAPRKTRCVTRVARPKTSSPRPASCRTARLTAHCVLLTAAAVVAIAEPTFFPVSFLGFCIMNFVPADQSYFRAPRARKTHDGRCCSKSRC